VEWQTRVVSSLHAAIVFPICFWIIITDNILALNPAFGTHPGSLFCCATAAGYFAADFTYVIWYKIAPMTPIILHHLFAGWAFLGGVSSYGQGLWFATLLLLTEATAGPNNLYWILQKLKLEHTKLYRVVGYHYLITWFIFRIVLNPYLLWKIYQFWDDVAATTFYFRVVFAINVVFLIVLNNAWFYLGPFYEITFGKKTHTH